MPEARDFDITGRVEIVNNFISLEYPRSAPVYRAKPYFHITLEVNNAVLPSHRISSDLNFVQAHTRYCEPRLDLRSRCLLGDSQRRKAEKNEYQSGQSY